MENGSLGRVGVHNSKTNVSIKLNTLLLSILNPVFYKKNGATFHVSCICKCIDIQNFIKMKMLPFIVATLRQLLVAFNEIYDVDL